MNDPTLYIVNALKSFFNYSNEEDFSRIEGDKYLNNFVNDVSVGVLTAALRENSFIFSNEISGLSNKTVVFIKQVNNVLNANNLSDILQIFTLNDSPLESLYAAFKGLFIPLLNSSASKNEPQLQQALLNFEENLRRTIGLGDHTDSSQLIASVADEISYWKNIGIKNDGKNSKEDAENYLAILQPFESEIEALGSNNLGDLDEVIESGVSNLDELWRMEGFSFPGKRMERLLLVVGDFIAIYVQKQISAMDIWHSDFRNVQESLTLGINGCEKWTSSIEQLCKVFWGGSSERPWTDSPPQHILCTNLSRKLRDALQVRSLHRQLTRLLSSSEQKDLNTAQLFDFFNGLEAGIWSPYTDDKWKSAVAQFDKSLVATEQRVATKLLSQLKHLNGNTLQLLQELRRYQELLKRPRIAAELIAERENLVGLLIEYVSSVDINGGDKLPLVDMPPVVSNIYWARQTKAKMMDILDTNSECLSDLKGSAELKQKTESVIKELAAYETDELDSWVREINKGIKSNELTLSEDGRVLDMNGPMVVVNYSPRLGKLVREVQQLSVLGLSIPAKIQELYHKALEFVKQANSLEQIAHFHNTIGDRMIASQRPMMLVAAEALEQLVTSNTSVTWSQTDQVDVYIHKLQTAVENLSRQNNILAFHHKQITDKVILLMDTDLIKQQVQWKNGVREVRDVLMQVEEMNFTNMKSWRVHWDYQIYKALEHQYQLSLIYLHTNLPEIKVQLVFRQQKLQFQPPVEEIKMKYYSQVKRFLNIPLSFRGVGDNTGALFSTILERNAHRFGSVFSEAEQLFDKLEAVRLSWRRWVALGGFSLEELASDNLEKAEDWDFNFRASKNLGQEIAKLPCDDVKVGCVTVSLLAIRTEMELQNRRYWDALASSLQAAVYRRSTAVSNYIEESTKSLNAPRHSMEQIAEAYSNHAQLLTSSAEILKMLEDTIKMNKTLASWTKEKMETVADVAVKWDKFQSQLHSFESIIGKQVEGMKVAVQGQLENLLSDADKFKLRWEQIRPRDTDIQDATPEQLKRSLNIIKEKTEEFQILKEVEEKIKTDYQQLGLPFPDLSSITDVENDLNNSSSIWSIYETFTEELNQLMAEDWILFRSKTYRLDDLLKKWETQIENEGVTPLTVRLLHEIQNYKNVGPLLKYVRGDAFSDRHWVELLSMLNISQKPVEQLTVGDFLNAKQIIVDSEEALQELNSRAASEIAVRQALSELDAWEVTAKFSLTSHLDAGNTEISIVKDFSEVLGKLTDQQYLVQSVARSNSGGLTDRTEAWERKLILLEECIKSLSTVQRKWIYLEPIFGNGSFTLEQPRFQRVDQDFRHIMADISQDNRVANLTRISNLKQTLSNCLDQLARCQAGLDQYLLEKRSKFPRFYFLGDDDLLELLGQSTKDKVIQAHLKKLFSGIHSTLVEDGFVKSISSLQGEKVNLSKPVNVTNTVEDWLSDLNTEIKSTLEQSLVSCLTDNNPVSYPCQILSLAESIRFAKDCEEAINNRKLRDFLGVTKEKVNSYTGSKIDWKEDQVLAIKLKSLLIDAVHHIDIIEDLIKNNVGKTDEWVWQKQLRFYMVGNKAVVRMADTEFSYSYEYQGTSAKLVRTPLTERCFLTLTQAMRSGLGGNPYGPAGTGKTESVKALGSLLGRQVLVFNCDEGIDVESMARIFVGLVKCGAWGCFDEFNRLEETTLSGVSMLIQPILNALRQKQPSVNLLEEDVAIDLNCAIFVTLNPAGQGYGGRQKLPDNLKALFRPIAMSAPDNLIIAQVSLLCDGYKNAKTIGRKLVELFDFCQHSLSQQDHYDWGLRALKTILGSCGSLLREKHNDELNDKQELEIAVEAVRFNTLSKLTFNDAQSFDLLVNDIFVGVDFVKTGFADLTQALAESCVDLGIEHIDRQISKCVEVWEQMEQRMGVALVGPSGSGKSTILRLLQHAVLKLGISIETKILNPKAMPRSELLGHVDVDTRQWTEGVLTSCAAQLAALPTTTKAWLICDGDIDPEWVESLNSVLDDNRLLTLPSGWRIQFGPNVNFLFETADLTYASPATVSRMGTIFLSDDAVNSSVLIKSWLKKQPEDVSNFLSNNLEDILPVCFELISKSGGLTVPYSLAALTKSALSLLHDVTNKSELAVGLIHGLCANMEKSSKENVAKKVLELTGEYLPNPEKVLDCYYNKSLKRIDIFTDDFNDQSSESLVLTASTKRNLATLEYWLLKKMPILLYGPQGSGKSILLQHCFDRLGGTEVATVYCTALTRPQHILYKLKQICVGVNGSTSRIYRAKSGGHLVLFLKGLELAEPDKYGTNILITWLQQLFTYGGFHDSDLEWATLDQIQIVISVATQGHKPNIRMTSQMLVFNYLTPTTADLKLILTPTINQFYKAKKLPSSVRSEAIIDTVLSIYKQLADRFGISQHKHYCLSPKILVKWCDGINRYPIENSNQLQSFLFALMYEGMRVFGDRMVSKEELEFVCSIFKTVLSSNWNSGNIVEDHKKMYSVSLNCRESLELLSKEEWMESLKKGDLISKGGESDLILTNELLWLGASVARATSKIAGSILLLGRPGTGRKTAVRSVATLQNARIITLRMTQNYSTKNFKTDLKLALQATGVDGQHVFFMLEDVELTEPIFMQMITNLISCGEVLGLYGAEELESMYAPLADSAARDGYQGTVGSYFSERIHSFLHVVLVLDFENDQFVSILEKNPSLCTKCEVVWSAGWSNETLVEVPKQIFNQNLETSSDVSYLITYFIAISKDIVSKSTTPRRYQAFIQLFTKIYNTKRKEMLKLIEVLQAGVSKLTEAQTVVDKLQKQAAEKEKTLAEKQAKAATALDLIGETMKNANTHKDEMEKLKKQTENKSVTLKERKKAIELELSEVEPLIEEARQAVGNIKNESLSEIRSLRAPPDVIRDILEGVLRLMGIQDTSWNSMKTFLAKRGVKEEIRTFDAHHISANSLEAAEALLKSRTDSFDQKVAKRASVAAAPLAAWVNANVQYARVVEKIRPLEREQATLEENLASAEAQVGKLSTGLGEVDQKVAELKDQLNTYTKEAAIIEVGLTKERETVMAAKELVSKLEGEYSRWKEQLAELSANLNDLPKDVFLAAAFISYLGGESLEKRSVLLEKWKEMVKRSGFDLLTILSSEQEKSRLASEGLPVDRQSVENSIVLLHSWLCPHLVDPDGEATTWLTQHSGENVEVISQSSPRFGRTLELAVRFGKILIVTDVQNVHPLLTPLLRKNILTQGTRRTVNIGDSVLDFNESFRLFLVTRDANFTTCFDASTVDFNITQPGLAGQLLTAAIDQEKPDLGSKRTFLLKEKEKLQAKLTDLQHTLLTQLGTAQGDILQNADLLRSLNETKASSEEIADALKKSNTLEKELNEECATYKPIADFSAEIFFALTPLPVISNMYRYSLMSFKQIFLKSFSEQNISFKDQKKVFIKMIYQFISRSLFKASRLVFALQLVRRCFEDSGMDREWEVLLGDVIPATNKSLVPDWADDDREEDIATLLESLPDFRNKLNLSDSKWHDFVRSPNCEDFVPDNVVKNISALQKVLVIQAFRPDRLHSELINYVCRLLNISSLNPNNASISQVFTESTCKEPILIVLSAGADPTQEIQALAASKNMNLKDVSLGQGQSSNALTLLTDCSANGGWLLLKNCHLMTDWMNELEAAWRDLKPHPDFRLWLTSEPHQKFPPVLARISLKLSFEAPPGVKKNLQKTYGNWQPNMIKGRGVGFSRLLFAAAWFHAIVQERRTFIPQGWSKFYEITDADLSAAVEILHLIIPRGAANVPWEWIRGLLEQSIYGGRIDSKQDNHVLVAYLDEYFSDRVLSGKSLLGGIELPSSELHADYLQLIHSLPDTDAPQTLSLAANIHRSWQKIASSEVLRSLKSLDSIGSIEHSRGVESWHEHLTPYLNLWKSLHQGLSLLQYKINPQTNPGNSGDPVDSFVTREFYTGLKLVQRIHKTLATITKIMKNTANPDYVTVGIAKALLNQQCPIDWIRVWQGPQNPRVYLRTIVNKTTALQKLQQQQTTILQTSVDLSIFFHPEALLKAVKQQSARKLKIPLDDLTVSCSWEQKGSRPAICCHIVNLLIEGGTFDGSRLVHTNEISPTISNAPPLTLTYVNKTITDEDGVVKIPLYRSSDRQNLVIELPVATEDSKQRWYKTGAAFFCNP